MILNPCYLLGEYTSLHSFVNKSEHEILHYSSCQGLRPLLASCTLSFSPRFSTTTCSTEVSRIVQIILGWILIVLGGAIYLAQMISSINFPLAQRLGIGIQEKAETSATILQRSERYTAYWDLLMLLWLPVAGTLMVIDHRWWPIMSLIAGSIYLDSSGREAVKNLSFRHEGINVGTANEQRVFFASYIVMAGMAIIVITFSIFSLSSLL